MKLAFRSLRKTPGFTAVIVLTLALGIGANTAIFSFFNGILLRPLPFHEPERVVAFKKHSQDFSDPVGTEVGFLAADFRELQPQIRAFEDMATYTLDSATVAQRGRASLVSAAIVTPNFFTLLGSPAITGRTFAPADAARAETRLAVLSHRYWHAHFGGDPSAVGQTLRVNEVSFTIVGVMPEDFALPREADFWVTPVADVPEHAIGQQLDFAGRGNYLRTILGRLAPDVTREQAEAELALVAHELPNPNRVQRSLHLVDLRDHTVGNVRPALAVLLGCVGLVLLIACFNVANLMLSRATNREREIGIRFALGASRWRIARHLLNESFALALAGGILGVLLSSWLLDLLVHVAPDNIPRLETVAIDGAVLGFAFGISVLTGAVSGLAPILGTVRPDLVGAIRRGGERGGSAGVAPRRLRTALVAGEVAISLVLLVAAGLLLRSLARMQAFPWGFRPEQVVSARVSFLEQRYQSDAARVAFYKALHDRLTTNPAVQSFGTSLDRIGESWIHLPFTAQGQVYANPADRPIANYHLISPGYLDTLRIPLLQGRDFAETDDIDAQRVVLIDSMLAERYFPDGNALGQTLTAVSPQGDIPRLIVGVVQAVKTDGPLGVARPDIYFSNLQFPQNNFYVHIRTPLAPAAAEALIRQAVNEIDAAVPVTDFASMEQVTHEPSAAHQFPLGLLGGFAGLALALAAVGIYAVTAYAVAQRTREIGVRMALGAAPGSVVRLVMRQGFGPIVIGMLLGLAGATVAAFAMRQMLFEVAPLDWPTFLAVPAGLALIAAVACLLPARRATKVDPLIALRAE